MVSKGHFVLHSRAKPPLGAGDYVLEGEQRVPDGDGGLYPTETYQGHLRVTSPRYRMPPEQILSTFPPANAEGAFESRLPQIVLKRRTLPWERIVDDDRNIPWLALVVIAEGEGAISAEVPVADCVTPGVTLSGPNDVPTGVHLTVPESVVTKVFPTKEDLHLLCHVREVDINDTELAIGDDDGFLAVVMANRLPQFDRVGCKPVRYLACLVNLEGQLDVLPPPTPPFDVFFPGAFVFEATAQMSFLQADTDLAVMGAKDLVPEAREIDPLGGAGGGAATRPAAAAAAPGGAARATPRAPAASAGIPAASRAASNQWSITPTQIEELAVSAAAVDAPALVRDAMAGGFRFPFEVFVTEQTYRFPVLAHWSFTCSGAGSFETLMQGLDVGMLGTVAGRPSGKPFPECYEEPGGDAPPDLPPPRPEAELAETGHVGLPHRTRRGEAVDSWYRGPFVPQLTNREPADSLAHVSDQLRRLVPDGREDLGEACGFEIGRLLALSHPSVVAAMMRWRREQFGAARAKRLGDLALEATGFFLPGLDVRLIDTLGPQIGRGILDVAGKNPAQVLGDSRAPVDPGRPIELAGEDLATVLATGFGLEQGSVKAALSVGDATLLEAAGVPIGKVQAPNVGSFGHLSQALDEVLGQLTDDALAAGATRPRRRARARPATPRDRGQETLERMLDDAARRATEEQEP
jgi:hypothetical protein